MQFILYTHDRFKVEERNHKHISSNFKLKNLVTSFQRWVIQPFNSYRYFVRGFKYNSVYALIVAMNIKEVLHA